MSKHPIDDVLVRFCDCVFGSADDFGSSPDGIAKAEATLGVTFPEVLKTFHMRVGRSKTIMQGQNRILQPTKCHLEENWLVFYEERQYVSISAIMASANDDDPPVFQLMPANDGAWEMECKRLSTFLAKAICWQAIGGLPAMGRAAPTSQLCESFERELWRVEVGEPDNEFPMIGYCGLGLAVCVFPQDTLFAAAVDEKRLHQFERDFSVDLDW